jgi:hypothetical protein
MTVGVQDLHALLAVLGLACATAVPLALPGSAGGSPAMRGAPANDTSTLATARYGAPEVWGGLYWTHATRARAVHLIPGTDGEDAFPSVFEGAIAYSRSPRSASIVGDGGGEVSPRGTAAA